ncbi:VanZ family protein [Alcanivorax sp. VBW004]|uniref:VanZ family protein n=1 Tax=Alcanivorax sp. VBW004 TaxID=1287708 RepID=UPI0012BCEB5E|nr:VanZ family protein [Alcanivorax sp. VBW004]MTT52821.1 VanZ family protein [Alcanivorax sp. VBW004]
MGRVWRVFLLAVITLLFMCGAMLPGEMRETVSKALSLGGIDAYAHVFFCALIALLLGWSWASPSWVFVLVMLLGGLIELVQLWIPYRSTTWSDVAGNAVGSIIGLLILWLGRQLLKRGSNG